MGLPFLKGQANPHELAGHSLELYPDFVSKTLDQWKQFINRRFAKHVHDRHAGENLNQAGKMA